MNYYTNNYSTSLPMYRTILFTLLLTIGWLFTLNAQNKSDRFAEIKTQKVAFLTGRMDLTVGEAEKFWPLYNEYEEAMWELKKRDRIKETNLTPDQAETFLFSNLDNEEKILDLKRNFYEQASKVVSFKKLYLMEKGEREFRYKLLERYRDKKGGKK